MSGAGATCPTCGAVSTDAEFCSDCGAAMTPPHPAPVVPAEAASGGGAVACPVCGETRPGPFARFCDTCRYDFLEKKPFGAASKPAPTQPASTPPPVGVAPVPPVPAPTLVAGPPARFDARAVVDVSLRRPEDPMPTDTRDRVFPLDLADHLVGRRSDSEDIHPEIVINDPGISRRHVRIMRAADGGLSVLDLGSMNGTRLNAVPLEANVPTPLAAGDELTLGCWTRLKIEAR